MHRIVHQEGDFIVKKIRAGYYVYNRKRRSKDEHTHIATKDGYMDLLKFIRERKVPNSSYLRESALRICQFKKYKKYLDAIEHKIEKDAQKPKFIRVNRGAVKTYR